MAGIESVDLEWNAEGMGLRATLWERDPPITNTAGHIAAARKALAVEETAIKCAKRGVPPINATEACSLERNIDSVYTLLSDREVRAASRAMGRATANLEQREVLADPVGLNGIRTDLKGSLETIETRFENDLYGPMHKLLVARQEVETFDDQNDTANVPTKKSTFRWGVSALAVAAVESVVNSTMMQVELGLLPGMGFSGAVGLGTAFIGTIAGIGFANLRRKQPERRLTGALMLMIGLVGGLLYMSAMGHYRAALPLGETQAAIAASASMSADMLAPFSDFSILPYLLLNIIGMAFIAAKAVPMFGFRDLQRLRERQEMAQEEVDGLRSGAIAHCEGVQKAGRELAQSQVDMASANAKAARQSVQEAHETVAECGGALRAFREAALADHQSFREIIAKFHLGGGRHARFKQPPAAIDVKAPEIPPALIALPKRFEDEAKAMRELVAAMLPDIDSAGNASRERLNEIYVEVEERVRSGATGPAKVYAFNTGTRA